MIVILFRIVQQSGGSNFLVNVSIDSELMESFFDDQLGSFDMDLSDIFRFILLVNQVLRELVLNLRDLNYSDYMEV